MNFDIKEGLIETVVSREFHKFAKEHSKEWEGLAAEEAVVMLKKIRDVLDTATSFQDLHTKIMKILIFYDDVKN